MGVCTWRSLAENDLRATLIIQSTLDVGKFLGGKKPYAAASLHDPAKKTTITVFRISGAAIAVGNAGMESTGKEEGAAGGNAEDDLKGRVHNGEGVAGRAHECRQSGWKGIQRKAGVRGGERIQDPPGGRGQRIGQNKLGQPIRHR